MKLIDLAEQQPIVNLHFNECSDFDDKNLGIIIFINNEKNNVTTLKTDLIFGADGAFMPYVKVCKSKTTDLIITSFTLKLRKKNC